MWQFLPSFLHIWIYLYPRSCHSSPLRAQGEANIRLVDIWRSIESRVCRKIYVNTFVVKISNVAILAKVYFFSFFKELFHESRVLRNMFWCPAVSPKKACLAGQQMPHPQINNDQAVGEKAGAKQGLQLHKTWDAAAGWLGRVGSAGAARAGGCRCRQATAPPCTCTCAPCTTAGSGRAFQGPLFRSAAHGGREPAQKCISSNVLRGDSCPSLIPPIYAS